MEGADGVYPPSEDTFLLIDALQNDKAFIRDRLGEHPFFVEIGCGSGEVSAAILSMIPGACCLCTDVNVLAARKTKTALEHHSTKNADVVLSDLFTAFKPNLYFDLIVFNPPYVPTDEDEFDRALKTRDISASWAGGNQGRRVIDKFLRDFVPFLSTRGVLYLVVLDANNPSQLEITAREMGLQVAIVIERRAGMEKLYILRFLKN